MPINYNEPVVIVGLCCGSIIAIALLVASPVGFIVVAAIVGAIYLLNKYSKKDLQKHQIEEYEGKKQALIKGKCYSYLKNFVKKYQYPLSGAVADYGSLQISIGGDSPLSSDLSNLKELLSTKGFQLTDFEFEKLILSEMDILQYDTFKQRMLANKPKKLDDYIKNLIELYDDSYLEHGDYLMKLLQEKNIEFNKESILDQAKSLKKEIELNHFEAKLSADDFQNISIEDLDSITGYDFEHFLKTLFVKMGYHVEQTKLSNDQGADLIVTKFGEKIVIQAKRYGSKVSNKAIQEAVAAIKHYGAEKGMVITTNEFTRSAIALASSNNIELIDRHKLEKLMQKYL